MLKHLYGLWIPDLPKLQSSISVGQPLNLNARPRHYVNHIHLSAKALGGIPCR